MTNSIIKRTSDGRLYNIFIYNKSHIFTLVTKILLFNRHSY